MILHKRSWQSTCGFKCLNWNILLARKLDVKVGLLCRQLQINRWWISTLEHARGWLVRYDWVSFQSLFAKFYVVFVSIELQQGFPPCVDESGRVLLIGVKLLDDCLLLPFLLIRPFFEIPLGQLCFVLNIFLPVLKSLLNDFLEQIHIWLLLVVDLIQ